MRSIMFAFLLLGCAHEEKPTCKEAYVYICDRVVGYTQLGEKQVPLIGKGICTFCVKE